MQLTLTLELHGAIVHTETVWLREAVWLGEHDEALLPFTGARLLVEPDGPAHAATMVIRGGGAPVRVREGGKVTIELPEGGALSLQASATQRLAREELDLGDVRLLVLTAALVLTGLWVDTLERWANTRPEVVAEVEAFTALFTRPPERVSAPVDPEPETHTVRFEQP